MCQTGLKLLARSDGFLGRLRWRLHGRLCAACQETRAAERFVESYVSRAGQWEAPASLSASAPARPVPSHAVRKETGTMKRLVYVSAIVVALGVAAALVAPRSNGPDADSILAAAAYAMESANSIHLVGRPTPPVDDIPVIRFTIAPPGTGGFDMWLSKDCIYSLTYGSDGQVTKGYAADAGADKWWFYSAKANGRYTADLSPLQPQAAEIIAKASDLTRTGLLGDEFASALGETLQDVQRWIVMQIRAGRQIAVVTTTYTICDEPQRVTGRLVIEIDPDTKRVFAIRQYIRAGEMPEKLLADIDRIEYNVPVPVSEIEDAIPPGARVVEATGAIEEMGPWLSLRIVDGDEVIVETDVPRDRVANPGP